MAAPLEIGSTSILELVVASHVLLGALEAASAATTVAATSASTSALVAIVPLNRLERELHSIR